MKERFEVSEMQLSVHSKSHCGVAWRTLTTSVHPTIVHLVLA
jgi:hypothetical protein